ncbi:peptidase S15 [Brachybacterium vulturis]|uniref:Peptidase S15 n=1 Tax=Brachybacterium vulturis TaxID=2017484 RepID=A0A291GR47_9MICO|nr:CocE/NonD family hydrolase [Brachybacterium vulturis]ATG52953.1 peptidase S15 [Brachybacterium vulturis]
MRTLETFPHAVQETQHLWIPMTDGTRLAARLWRPFSSDADPVPGVLELIPYRQRDLTAQRDSIHHPYLAGHGYACLRVDLRGSGNSEGVLTDEYLDQELTDAEEILAWLAAQPWCSGRTGMMGISWGGFNALQVAARRPPSLGAVISCSSTDDRYTDDVHYMGGCLLTDNLSWASTMFAYNACPPDPAIVGEAWRGMWRDRLEGSGLWLETWLRHQRRDDYWKHGSVNEDYSAIEVPVMAVSGWADGYSNSVFRLLENLSAPVRGLIGPWSHKYPHLGEPGPAIGFLQEAVRWWDHWLKGDRRNGAMDGPALTIWMQDSAPPATTYEQRPGRWVGEPTWPSENVVPTRFPLGFYSLHAPGEEVRHSDPRSVRSPLSVGQFAGKWCSYNAPPDMPYDQREEDGGSLVFTSRPLTETLELLGAAEVELDLSVDQPCAQLIVRLSDIGPDGEATRISYGVLNLTHHRGSDAPEDLVPGQRHVARLPLNGMAQSFPPGHQLRLSVSTSYWPVVWPPPQPVRMTIHPLSSALVLPVRQRPDEEIIPEFEEAEGAAPLRATQLAMGAQDWQVSRNMVDLSGRLEVVKDLGTVRFEDIDLEVRRRARETYSFIARDVHSMRGETLWEVGFARGDWSAHATTRTVLTSTATDFHVYAELDAWEGTERVHSQTWSTSIPRDHV